MAKLWGTTLGNAYISQPIVICLRRTIFPRTSLHINPLDNNSRPLFVETIPSEEKAIQMPSKGKLFLQNLEAPDTLNFQRINSACCTY